MKDLVFSKEMQSHINDFSTLKNAIPEKLGKSGTPEGQMMMDMFNPKRTALDFAVKKTLEQPGSVPASKLISDSASNVSKAKVLQFLGSTPKSAESVMPTYYQKAADNETTNKGPEKWANDGADKIQQHDSGFTPAQIEQIKKSKKGRDLLIKASDLQPNSKAMNKIIEQIKSGSMNESEE